VNASTTFNYHLAKCGTEICYRCITKKEIEERERLTIPGVLTKFFDAQSYLLDHRGVRIQCILKAVILSQLMKVEEYISNYRVANNDHGCYLCTTESIEGFDLYFSFKLQ